MYPGNRVWDGNRVLKCLGGVSAWFGDGLEIAGWFGQGLGMVGGCWGMVWGGVGGGLEPGGKHWGGLGWLHDLTLSQMRRQIATSPVWNSWF